MEADMADFKKGDIVVLKSGGPKMTVNEPDSYGGNVDTVWFAGAKRETASFDPESLQLAPEDPKK
jgi:uncharacterized protein YodC (DUF2158 family)